ncbi:MAG: hypothetical protein [Wendovervirus sonii]|uniref:Uncharacterized protein n=1 Tax=phage Lak_Megaphage_Sonny TaxID=3109229 RepID=A0ABZ0Z656_9CAUD|nr:MAG: hypothetical protein [phage Lak_Megaphage_Sonny]
MKKLTFLELAKREKTLTSLHGNCGLDPYSLIVNKEAVEDDERKQAVIEMSKITNEPTLYFIDKGNAALDRLFDDYPSEEISFSSEYNIHTGFDFCIREKVEKIEFEEDVNIYKETYTMRMNSVFERHWYYINVRRVVLPSVSKITESSENRLYIVSGKDGNIYKFPTLKYPAKFADFVKWLKKKRRIKFAAEYIWNKSISHEKILADPMLYWSWSTNGYLIQNLKTEKDIDEYNRQLKSIPYKSVMKAVKEKASLEFNDFYKAALVSDDLPLINVNITQKDIDEYIDDKNSGLKIER